MSHTGIAALGVTVADARSPKPSSNVGESPRQMADRFARDLLGVSTDRAFAMLDAGELDGTLAGDAMASARWLIGD